MKNIQTYDDLCLMLDFNIANFFTLLNQVKNGKGYTKFNIPKKSGENREILAPNKLLKNLQRKIKDYIESKYKIHSCALGFKKGSSNIKNAEKHTKPNWCLNLDLKDYFPSINFGRVYGLFKAEPFNANKKIAVALAHILCFNNKLPQGAPSSPLIANLISFSLDNKLFSLAKEYHCCYTRYADDITFSSHSRHIPSDLIIYDNPINKWFVGDKLQQAIENCGFTINNSKTRLLKKNQRQEVTGIIVNNKINLPREYYKELRSIFFKIKIEGIEETAKNNHEVYCCCKDNSKNGLISFINGKMAYYKSVVSENNIRYNKLCKMYNELIEYKYKNCFYNKNELIKNSMFIIESDYSQGTAFLLKDVGLLTCKHCLGFAQNENCLDENFRLKKETKENDFYVYQVDNPNIRYKIKIQKVYQNSDLAILKVLDYDNHIAFKLAEETLSTNSINCTLLGFPNYSAGSSINELNNIQIISKKMFMGIEYYCIDKPIITGNSGGPLLNEKNEVLGIACRGAENIELANDTDFNGVLPIHNIYTENDN